jgi:hypothetical protein
MTAWRNCEGMIRISGRQEGGTYLQEGTMAKGQMRSVKERKKPKQEKKIHQPSAYAQQYKGKVTTTPVEDIKKQK